ncbi:MAG: hypothetical protein Q8M40_11790 [Legionella sp.]|nr:hypothetical protein [Legionella sp.]
MPNYFDPITLENTPIVDTSTIYLVQSDEHSFTIRGVSSGIDQLASDPFTHANAYWLIPVADVLNESTKKNLFDENDNLITRPLNLDEVIKYLNINPLIVKPRQFAPSLGQSRNNSEAVETSEDRHPSQITNARNPQGFFSSFVSYFNEFQNIGLTPEHIGNLFYNSNPLQYMN